MQQRICGTQGPDRIIVDIHCRHFTVREINDPYNFFMLNINAITRGCFDTMTPVLLGSHRAQVQDQSKVHELP